MTNTTTTKSGDNRARADRLRAIRRNMRSLGKRGLLGTFEAGEALEEAAALLRGSFSAWVKSECGIEPRTALGYRKTFRVLGARKDWLAERNVSSSVAMAIACAGPEGRERALNALASGRSLSVAEAKAMARATQPRRKVPMHIESLARAARYLSGGFVAEAARIVSLAADADLSDEARLGELTGRARAVLPFLSALSPISEGGMATEPLPLVSALRELALAEDPGDIAAAARQVGQAAASEDMPTDSANLAEEVPAAPLRAVASIASVSSAFDHGLTAFEICAGGGGQAAGLAKAGFRHVGLVERDPSACRTLRAAFGSNHVLEADLVGLEPRVVDRLDLLAGGVPCQPFSQAGERRGAADERDLFPEALRLVGKLQPRAVMLENVAGIFAPDNDVYRFGILARLERLGYSAEWRRIDCSHFGVPQKRIRAILVAFREKRAMERFSWPRPLAHHGDVPHPVIARLFGQLTSCGWVPPTELMDRMDRAAPTVTGGSDRKQGIDFGKRKSALVWGDMGFVQTRIGDKPPEPGHEGDVEATNAMIAALQGFAFDWPWQGTKKAVFRQIANAFPPAAALHLGCAIASALTGEPFDPMRQYVHEGMRWIRTAHRGPSPDGVTRRDEAIERARAIKTVQLPLASLRAASDIVV